MRITVVGTGNMGRGVAARALAGGHDVSFVGTWLAKAQDVADELAGLGPVSASERVEGDLAVLAVPYGEAPARGVQHDPRRNADDRRGRRSPA
jgi:predicted dinucleotide-binding enzyme